MSLWLLKVGSTSIFPFHMGKDVNWFEETGMGLDGDWKSHSCSSMVALPGTTAPVRCMWGLRFWRTGLCHPPENRPHADRGKNHPNMLLYSQYRLRWGWFQGCRRWGTDSQVPFSNLPSTAWSPVLCFLTLPSREASPRLRISYKWWWRGCVLNKALSWLGQFFKSKMWSVCTFCIFYLIQNYSF